MEDLKKSILKTLLYYDIFAHPLRSEEIFAFLPRNSVSLDIVKKCLAEFSEGGTAPFAEKDGFYYIKPSVENITNRLKKEEYSRRMWKRAQFVTHVIKRFPFVRAVMITGSLSKNSSDTKSDLDFMVITKAGRLWISRTLLMLFKKIFLLNSYKYFCINYFVAEDSLEIEDKNIFSATEVATVKFMYNRDLLAKFLESNNWIKSYFPNYVLCDPMLHSPGCRINNSPSLLQRLFELPFFGPVGKWLNNKLMLSTIKHWNKRYAHVPEPDRNHMFRSTPGVSKTHPGNMQKKILGLYDKKLKDFDL
jgi:predicted nucleotidyltransferase